MDRFNLPSGLRAIGYSSVRHSTLVEGTLLQRRLTTLSPREAGADELGAIFEEAM